VECATREHHLASTILTVHELAVLIHMHLAIPLVAVALVSRLLLERRGVAAISIVNQVFISRLILLPFFIHALNSSE
jgi:hypothetical protein